MVRTENRRKLSDSLRPIYVSYKGRYGSAMLRQGWRSFTARDEAENFRKLCEKLGFEAGLHSKHND